MTIEKQLITKTYHHTLGTEDTSRHPIEILGEAFLVEQEKDLFDLSYIRFAQGEVYFHNKDFESAIFKWENITNEFEPWAKKNIADTYYQLGLLASAEEVYISIASDSNTLNSEVSLQLFSLYIEMNKIDLAYQILKKTTTNNPEYPNVTSIAQDFYEGQADWKNAVELAVEEALRTDSLDWFKKIIEYCTSGHSRLFTPTYFDQVLRRLFDVNHPTFKELTKALWSSYQGTVHYISWLHAINQILKSIEIDPQDSWHIISDLFEDSYFDLVSGDYLLKEVENLMPRLLTNWLNTTTAFDGLAPASAVLAWNDVFPSSIKSTILKEAEIISVNTKKGSIHLEDCLVFMKTIIEWAQKNNIETSNRLVWCFNQLYNLQSTNILLIGNRKSSFSNSILGDHRIDSSISNIISIRYGKKAEMMEVSDYERKAITTTDEISTSDTIIEIKLPSMLLNNAHVGIITTEINEYNMEKNKTIDYLPVADGVLFVLNGDGHLSEDEITFITYLKQVVKDSPVHFVLNTFKNSEETNCINQINEFFPNAKVSTYHSFAIENMANILQNFNVNQLEQKRSDKTLVLIRKMLASLMKKRVEAESKLVEVIHHDEDFVTRLTGLINSVSDIEKEQTKDISGLYKTIKAQISTEITDRIPKLLRGCSKFIKEESNFKQIHIELNERMNEEIQTYFQEEVLQKFSSSLSEWLDESKHLLEDSEKYLNEMTKSLAELYPDKELNLECDFKVIDDWRRDINRMTYRIQIEKENIMLRHNPVQVLLKGAGKVLGLLPQNNTLLHQQYKRYVENEVYADITNSIKHKFLLQFDLFEKALEQDIEFFYKESLRSLENKIDETNEVIAESQKALADMKSNPEMYYDPLRLFEVRLVQYERMNRKNQRASTLQSI